MITDDLPGSFEQLVVFGQRPDVKIRPVLLRVLVDMFVSKPQHGTTELKQFEEMMAHLLDDADDETRLVVAEKLSLDPNTPRALLDRFVAERGAIAAKVLTHAAMEIRTLNAAAVFGTAAMAVAVAGRADLDPSVARRLAERPEPEVLLALVTNRQAPIERAAFRYLVRRAQTMPDLASKLVERGDPAGEATSLFLKAGPSQRADMIAAARRQDLGQVGQPSFGAPSVEVASAIARASKMPGLDGLDLALAVALNASAAEIERLIDDRHGEPLALALAAVGVTPETAARIFILGNPSIGHSYLKVKTLVTIVETVSARAAYRLVTAMLSRPEEPFRRPAVHVPVQAEPSGRRTEPAVTRPQSSTAAPAVRHGHRAR